MKELFELAEQEGKVVIASEDGKIKGVLLSLECYHVLSGSGIKAVSSVAPHAEPQAPTGPDAETINRAITEAQLEIAMPQVAPSPAPVPLNSVLARRVNELRQRQAQSDLRAEVMDPNFDYSPPTLSVDDEVIRPGFDDI
jgi:hypothetical protein